MSEEKKVSYVKYQQGDVVMLKLNKSDFNEHLNHQYALETTSYKGTANIPAVLAFGEVTGHTHRVEMKDMLEEAGVKLHMSHGRTAGKDVPVAFTVEEADVTLIHEEHDDVVLPPGRYVLKIVREFNHITRRAQNVAD